MKRGTAILLVFVSFLIGVSFTVLASTYMEVGSEAQIASLQNELLAEKTEHLAALARHLSLQAEYNVLLDDYINTLDRYMAFCTKTNRQLSELDARIMRLTEELNAYKKESRSVVPDKKGARL